MTAGLATAACAAVICYLFWTDFRRGDGPSLGVWIPLVWLFLAASRYVSYWLGMAPPMASAFAEGSPIDRAVFAALMLAGLVVLSGRQIDWGQLIARNSWISIYLAYCLLSAAWADDPATLAKRWIKDLGNFEMALVILTERRPYETAALVLRRLSFVLLPMSVLFVKYFPELGRDYRPDGSPMYTGVGQQKNALGLMCLLAGAYLSWEILRYDTARHRNYVRQNVPAVLMLVVAMAWLLQISDSKTSLVCLVAAVLVLLVARLPFVRARPGWIVAIAVGGTLTFWVANELADLRAIVLTMLGRRPDLTNRADIWQTLQAFAGNPLIGVGFMSFWSGPRLAELWRALGAPLNQAHNGYIEQYLNLGVIGVAGIVAVIAAGLADSIRHFGRDPSGGVLRLCFIIMAIFYNYTEAAFFGMHVMWMLLLMGCIWVPREEPEPAMAVPDNAASPPNASSTILLAGSASGPLMPQSRATSPILHVQHHGPESALIRNSGRTEQA